MEKAEQKEKEKENFEQKKTEVSSERLSLSDIDNLLKENAETYTNLNLFYRTDIFKEVDFQDKRAAADKLKDEFDESAYVKAGFWQKYENFTRFGLRKESHGLLKSKERGLLDKTEIDEDIIGKDIEIAKDNKKEREYIESAVIDVGGDFKKEESGRIITKRYEKIDGEIVKIFESKRNEAGEIEAAVKLKDEKIKEADVLGTDLIKSKEQLKKHLNDKDKLENLKYLSAEGKEDLRKKMAEEQSDLDALIKDKKQELEDKLSIFKEPLEERKGQTQELLNKVSGAFEFAKKEETETSKKLKEIDSEIKLIEQSGILEGSKNQIIDSLKAGKNEMANNLKEIALRKKELDNRLSILKINKQDLDKELSKINKIGKTKEEIAEEEKVKKEENKKDANEDGKKETGKTQTNDLAEDRSFMTEKKKYENHSEKYAKADDEEKTENGDSGEEILNAPEKTFTEKEIENVVKTHLKIIGLSKIKDKKTQEKITKEAIWNVKKMIEKTETPTAEIHIRKETKRVFDALSAGYFKRNKQS